ALRKVYDQRSEPRLVVFIFFCQAEDGIRDRNVTGVQTCALPIFSPTTIIVVGEISTEVSEIIESWKRQQQTIYQVKTSVDSAFITRWVKEVTHDVEQTS